MIHKTKASSPVSKQLCIDQGGGYYWRSGTYVAYGKHDGYPTYELNNPCGNKILYYNAQTGIQKLLIYDFTDNPDDDWIAWNANCNDNGITNPLDCESWWPSSPTTMTVNKGECDQLCGEIGACSPQSYIDIDDIYVTNDNCNGIFYRHDYVDNIYQSQSGQYYWYFKGSKWRCVNQLPSNCLSDGYPDNIYTLTNELMIKYSTCNIPKGQKCN